MKTFSNTKCIISIFQFRKFSPYVCSDLRNFFAAPNFLVFRFRNLSPTPKFLYHFRFNNFSPAPNFLYYFLNLENFLRHQRLYITFPTKEIFCSVKFCINYVFSYLQNFLEQNIFYIFVPTSKKYEKNEQR